MKYPLPKACFAAAASSLVMFHSRLKLVTSMQRKKRVNYLFCAFFVLMVLYIHFRYIRIVFFNPYMSHN